MVIKNSKAVIAERKNTLSVSFYYLWIAAIDILLVGYPFPGNLISLILIVNVHRGFIKQQMKKTKNNG